MTRAPNHKKEVSVATVVIGLDSGDSSTRAVQFALERHKSEDFALVLVHIINWSPFSFNTPEENDSRHARRQAEIAAADEQIIDPMQVLVKEAGMTAESVVRHGNPSESLVAVATEHEACHIIIGRAGDSGLRAHVFGSVVSRLVQHAPVPVTVVP